MKERGKRQRGLSKKIVIVLVVIAIILVSFAVVYNYFDLGKKISTVADSGNEQLTDSSGGKVGVVILPPEIEDKGVG